jgi:bacteriophage N4 adsorption protein B
MIVDAVASLLVITTRELTLFAAAGLLVGGIDDVAVDMIWAARCGWKRLLRSGLRPQQTASTLPPPARPGRIGVFIACWHEATVIRSTLESALARIRHDDYRIYVGTYVNDPATVAEVEAVRDPRIRLVEGDVVGPTTKAECLNRVWAAARHDELTTGITYKAFVLHDAEDELDADELRVFDALIERYDLVQLPVLPLIRRHSWWARQVSGHYADEFAEAHGRQLAVRSAIGAGIPSAGVGCAISRRALGAMARTRGGRPFDETSLTEDYEIGLRLAGFGGKAAFVAMPCAPGKPLVATRAYFPHSMDAAVRQKTRWMIGIALAGWDRLRWEGGWAETWMRLRDRRAILAALVLVVSYAALLLSGACALLGIWPVHPRWGSLLLDIAGGLLIWRLLLRATTVAYYYGWIEGLWAVPRAIVANVIAMAAARRAFFSYVPGVTPPWDKTDHHPHEALLCD